MLISVAYNPTVHDLWLYEDHVVSWTNPTPSNLTVKRPYAWNPNSPLYGYRKSIQAMPAVYRIMTTNSGVSAYGANLASNPVNRPVFYNSYCPWKAYFISETLGLQSEHWQVSNVYRDPAETFANQYASDGVFAATMLIRYITHDNQIFDLSPAEMIWPYNSTSIAFGSVPVFGSSGIGAAALQDCAAVECPNGIPVPPIKMADARTAIYGSTCYYLDSNFKIVPIQWRYCGHYTNDSTKYVVATGAEEPPVAAFLHDSGSCIFIELQPPTSAAAGDGILAIVTRPVINSADFIDGTRTSIAFIPPEDHATSQAVLYQQSLGNEFPIAIPQERPTDQALASQTTALQILSLISPLVESP
jgi:hypothetical protein